MPNDIKYLTPDNNTIQITTYGQISENNPAIVITHGFKGFKDWGFFPYAAEYFNSLGFFVLTFNFSHNGIGEIKGEFTEETKFAENTYSRETAELNDLVHKLKQGYFDNIKPKDVGILGHSRGGGISILVSEKIKPGCLVTWSSVSTFDRYTDHQVNQWKEKGFYPVVNSRTGQEFKMNLSFLEDIEANINDKLNIEKSVCNMNIPWLIIHGKEDLTVKKEEAEQLFEWADKQKTSFSLIENAGHTFNIVHPFAGNTVQFEEVLKQTGDFFCKHLKGNN